MEKAVVAARSEVMNSYREGRLARTHTHTYIHTRTHTLTHTHACTHTHTCTHTYTHAHVHTRTHARTHTHTHTHMHAHTCTHMRAHVHTHTHTHAHTHTHRLTLRVRGPVTPPVPPCESAIWSSLSLLSNVRGQLLRSVRNALAPLVVASGHTPSNQVPPSHPLTPGSRGLGGGRSHCALIRSWLGGATVRPLCSN